MGCNLVIHVNGLDYGKAFLWGSRPFSGNRECVHLSGSQPYGEDESAFSVLLQPSAVAVHFGTLGDRVEYHE